MRPVARWQLMMALTLSVPAHALREAGDDALRRTKEIEELGDVGLCETGCGGGRADVGCDRAGACERWRKALGVRGDIGMVGRARVGEMDQQAGKQGGVHPGSDWKKQVGLFRGRDAPGIDDDDPRAAFVPVLDHALEQHRMAPGRVRPDQHDEIGLIEILIQAGNRVSTEGAAMACDR
jgi:hypothetical protein